MSEHDCFDCQYGDIDYIWDPQVGEEYPLVTCLKGIEKELYSYCADYKPAKLTVYEEQATECDKCEYLKLCESVSEVVEVTTIADKYRHIICDQRNCQKRRE